MKKFHFIALTALAGLLFTSCESYDLPNPPAQSNTPEAIFNDADLTVASVVNGETLDLGALSEAQLPAELFSVQLKNFPKDYNLVLQGQFSKDDTFAATQNVDMTVGADDIAAASAAELQTMFTTLVSKSPDTRTIYVRVAAFAVNGSSSVRIGGPDKYYYSGEVTIKPIALDHVIEDAYYLVGSFCNWDVKKGIPFIKNEEGNVYDHPNFQVKIDVTAEQAAAGGLFWKVVPKSAYDAGTWAGAYGSIAGDSNLSGSLTPAPETETEAGLILEEGPYIIHINMETLRYNIDRALDYLWVVTPGTSTTKFDLMQRLTNNGDYTHYEGTSPMRYNFYLAGQASKNGVFFHLEGESNKDGKGTYSGMMSTTTTKTMKVGDDLALYYVTANINEMTWKATQIHTLNLVGAFNGWNQKEAPALTHNAKFSVWTITETFKEAGEFKFCVDNDWKLSYGSSDGTFNTVKQNGGNYKMTEAGTYTLTLHFDVFPPYLEVVKK